MTGRRATAQAASRPARNEESAIPPARWRDERAALRELPFLPSYKHRPPGLRPSGHVAGTPLSLWLDLHLFGFDPVEDAELYRNALDAAWWLLRRRFELNDPPPPEAVALAVRHGGPIPDDMRGHIADMLEGKAKRRRGPKRFHSMYDPAAGRDRLAWAYRVVRWKRVYEREKARTGKMMDAYRSALWKVSEESGIPESTLDRWLYPRASGADRNDTGR